VLEGYEVAPYDQAEPDRLRAAEIDDPEDDPMILVEASSRSTPRLLFQLVPDSKLVKNRVHLDLTCADVGARLFLARKPLPCRLAGHPQSFPDPGPYRL